MDADKNSQQSDDQKPDQKQIDQTVPKPVEPATPSEPSQPSVPSQPDLTEPELEAPEAAPQLPAEDLSSNSAFVAEATLAKEAALSEVEGTTEESKEELPAPKETKEGQEGTEDKDDKEGIPSQPSKPSESSQPTRDVKGAKWYVVHTYSGHEAKVAATLKQKIDSLKLEDKVLDILVPTQDKIEIKEGKKTTVKEKIFPGYLLIRMLLDDDTWLAVRTTPGITSFVGISNQPTPLPDEEVASIQRFMHMEAPKFKTAFSLGEAVKITDGPFSEFLGTISEIDDEKGKIKVLVSIFGRETPVELDFLQVAKL